MAGANEGHNMIKSFWVCCLTLHTFFLYPADNKINEPVELKQTDRYTTRTPTMLRGNQILPAPPPLPIQEPLCSARKIKRCCITTCCLTSLALSVISIYATANPKQQCFSTDNVSYLNASKSIDMEGFSFDLIIGNCGKCAVASIPCNNPIPNVQNSEQLYTFINNSMRPICGDKARYHIKRNVFRSDPLAHLPGRGLDNENNLDAGKQFIAEGCKIPKPQSSKPFSKFEKDHRRGTHDKRLSGPRQNFTHSGKSKGGRKRGW